MSDLENESNIIKDLGNVDYIEQGDNLKLLYYKNNDINVAEEYIKQNFHFYKKDSSGIHYKKDNTIASIWRNTNGTTYNTVSISIIDETKQDSYKLKYYNFGHDGSIYKIINEKDNTIFIEIDLYYNELVAGTQWIAKIIIDGEIKEKHDGYELKYSGSGVRKAKAELKYWLDQYEKKYVKPLTGKGLKCLKSK